MKPCTLYVSRIVVQGIGEFPIDMLRYDSCMPWDEEDSHKMSSVDKLRQITLRRVCPNERPPQHHRWESFHWKVIFETPLEGWLS